MAESVTASAALGMRLAERSRLPDTLIRMGIRRLLGKRLKALNAGDWAQRQERKRRTIHAMKQSPIAVNTHEANGQHYEVPPFFFEKTLGAKLKYSCAYWSEGVRNLNDAEAAALELVGQRARLADGQHVLELGCGWGSLTLWMAKKFPRSKVVGVSNSAAQRRYIEGQARLRDLDNIEIVTQDINRFDTLEHRFDRVVSIEMFEHTRNWEQLLRHVGRWLKPEGRLFVHVFAHHAQPYFFETARDDDWMGRFFFTGGLMPSDDLMLRFQDNLVVDDHWVLNGTHYAKTARAWLENQDAHREQLMPLLEDTYGSKEAGQLWWQRWRIFWMACEELWAYRHGNEWGVSHYLMSPRR